MLELRSLPQMIYAGVRNIGPYQSVGPAFQRILGWASQEGYMKPDTKVIGLSWDNPNYVPPDKLRYDAAITLDRPVSGPEDIIIGALPAMNWAMTTHKGSYGKMTETFMFLGKAMSERPDLIYVPLCGLEIYRNDPSDTPEAELLTDIGFPVVKVS